MMFTPLRDMARAPETRVLMVGAAATIAVGMVVYHVLEGWGWVDCLYFTVVTLATVGFGDLHPTTGPAKLFTVVYILIGIGILAAFVSELAKHRQAPKIERAVRQRGNTCPNCGFVSRPGDEAAAAREEDC